MESYKVVEKCQDCGKEDFRYNMCFYMLDSGKAGYQCVECMDKDKSLVAYSEEEFFNA